MKFLTLADWRSIGTAVQTDGGAGQYEFDDSNETGSDMRFYRIVTE